MTDIPNWLQVGAGLAGTAISLGTTVAACLSASESAKAATKSGQTAGAMLWLEGQRRHDELHPTRNGLRISLTNYGRNTAMLIKIDRQYAVTYHLITQNNKEHSGKFYYMDDYKQQVETLFDGIEDKVKTMEIGFNQFLLSSRCGCQQIGKAHWTYSPTADELEVVGWIPLN
jgi:hypothetical protein